MGLCVLRRNHQPTDPDYDMTPQLRPTIWLERDGSPMDDMKEGVERLVNLHCHHQAQQIALCRVAVCRQLQRIRNHPIRFQVRRVFRENTMVQLSLWQAAHKQLTGRIYEPDDASIDELAALWKQTMRSKP